MMSIYSGTMVTQGEEMSEIQLRVVSEDLLKLIGVCPTYV